MPCVVAPTDSHFVECIAYIHMYKFRLINFAILLRSMNWLRLFMVHKCVRSIDDFKRKNNKNKLNEACAPWPIDYYRSCIGTAKQTQQHFYGWRLMRLNIHIFMWSTALNYSSVCVWASECVHAFWRTWAASTEHTVLFDQKYNPINYCVISIRWHYPFNFTAFSNTATTGDKDREIVLWSHKRNPWNIRQN